MKNEFGLINKLCGYSICSITDKVVQVSDQILACKVMRKCLADEVSTLVISLAAQCMKGVQYNWAQYFCKEFLLNFCEAQDDGKAFHYTWLLLLISVVVWRLPEGHGDEDILGVG